MLTHWCDLLVVVGGGDGAGARLDKAEVLSLSTGRVNPSCARSSTHLTPQPAASRSSGRAEVCRWR